MAIEIIETTTNPHECDIRPHNSFSYHSEIVDVKGFRIEYGYSYVLIQSRKFMSETLCVPLHEIYCLAITSEIMKLFTSKTELVYDCVLVRMNVKQYELMLRDRETGKEQFFRTLSYVHELQNLIHDFEHSAPSFPLNLEFIVKKSNPRSSF